MLLIIVVACTRFRSSEFSRRLLFSQLILSVFDVLIHVANLMQQSRNRNSWMSQLTTHSLYTWAKACWPFDVYNGFLQWSLLLLKYDFWAALWRCTAHFAFSLTHWQPCRSFDRLPGQYRLFRIQRMAIRHWY